MKDQESFNPEMAGANPDQEVTTLLETEETSSLAQTIQSGKSVDDAVAQPSSPVTAEPSSDHSAPAPSAKAAKPAPTPASGLPGNSPSSSSPVANRPPALSSNQFCPPSYTPPTYNAASNAGRPATIQPAYPAGQKATYQGLVNSYTQSSHPPVAVQAPIASPAKPTAAPIWPSAASSAAPMSASTYQAVGGAPTDARQANTGLNQPAVSPYRVNPTPGQAAAAPSSYGASPYNFKNMGQTAYQQGYSPYNVSAPVPKKPAKKPITARTAIVICIIITMILSPLLGFGGAMLARSFSSSAVSDNIIVVPDSNNPWSSVVDSVLESSVSIYVGISGGNGWNGSGVVITADGFILTNWHVAGDPRVRSINVTLFDGTDYEATLVASDENIDTALIKINGRNLDHVKIGDSSTVKVGDVALGIGNPLGMNPDTVSEGIIAHQPREVEVDWVDGIKTFKLLQTTVSITGGNSGGGLFNHRGELIGLNNAGWDPAIAENIAFAVPIDDVLQFLHTSGHVSVSNKSSLYIETQMTTTQSAAQQIGGDGAGIIITGVERYGACDYAGIREGDRIISVDGRTFSSTTELDSYIAGLAINAPAELVISRGGQQYLYTVKTMRLPQS